MLMKYFLRNVQAAGAIQDYVFLKDIENYVKLNVGEINLGIIQSRGVYLSSRSLDMSVSNWSFYLNEDDRVMIDSKYGLLEYGKEINFIAFKYYGLFSIVKIQVFDELHVEYILFPIYRLFFADPVGYIKGNKLIQCCSMGLVYLHFRNGNIKDFLLKEINLEERINKDN